ncbi:nuclear transport factor 2 family protein [Flagellimonas nanhaiensis]|uniref:SnoaL-like domain-containing protein n=1 Tax=Flagellimonas nanhaiensis TaxID=2292706 RepID=A0A371JV87_9FLAO|nr:nuclear transport factor 2 family protein [Allomuricauda nanhaiensis]RDY61713.1 hypothetical protein DX873_06075 [Allomuricauda nanhaiensis]
MKSLLAALAIITLSALKAQNMEQQKPKDIVIQLFTATDQRDWDKVENCFSNSVLLDYSSMGNPSATLKPKQIIDSWKTILPGFSHTHHQIGNIQEKITKNKAHVFAYGTATHYLEDENGNIWTVVGSYDFDLTREDNQWKISKMKFNFKYQDGNTALPQKAINTVQGKQNFQNAAERNKTNARAFLKALEDEDLDILVDLFAKDGKHLNPYHSDLFPEGATGKEEIRAYWTPVFPSFDGMQFPIEEIYSMELNRVFVKFKGSIKLKNNQGDYKNDYYAIFKFDKEGKILEYEEIFNPIKAAKSFGLIEKIVKQ